MIRSIRKNKQIEVFTIQIVKCFFFVVNSFNISYNYFIIG